MAWYYFALCCLVVTSIVIVCYQYSLSYYAHRSSVLCKLQGELVCLASRTKLYRVTYGSCTVLRLQFMEGLVSALFAFELATRKLAAAIH